jgi:hypothetical protein
MFRRGADELDAVILDRLHEIGVLGEEAVAGVDRLRAGDLGGRQDGGHAEVAVRGGRRADADRLVGHAHMHRVGIRRGMDRDAFHAHLAGRADDAQRDLAAVGDQDLLEHRRARLTR